MLSDSKAKSGAQRETSDHTSVTDLNITRSDFENGASLSTACSSTSSYGALKGIGATSKMFSD